MLVITNNLSSNLLTWTSVLRATLKQTDNTVLASLEVIPWTAWNKNFSSFLRMGNTVLDQDFFAFYIFTACLILNISFIILLPVSETNLFYMLHLN